MIGAIVVGTLMGTAGATAASAAPVTASSSSVSSASFVSATGGTTTGGPVGGPTTGAPIGTDGASTNGVPIGPIINWVKRNAPSLITPMKNAVKKGSAAFKRWWAGVAGWIKAAINAIATMTIQQLFDALWNYFF